MDDEVNTLFSLSLETLESSRKNIEINEYKTSVNRSFYATFYAAKALLIKKGVNPKTHTGTSHHFGLDYVVNGDFNPEIAEIFSDLEDERENVDHNFRFVSNEEDAIDALKRAQMFIGECRKFL